MQCIYLLTRIVSIVRPPQHSSDCRADYCWDTISVYEFQTSFSFFFATLLAQNNARNQRSPSVLSRSNSESGSNRMSISSDIEGPPSEPLSHAATTALPDRTNTDIREEDSEGDTATAPPPLAGALNGNSEAPRETVGGKFAKHRQSETDCDNATTAKDRVAPSHGVDAAACMKYGLAADTHAHLELDLATELAKGRKEDDSDTETVYQSANEDEDPEYEEERTRLERERRQGTDEV